MDSDTSIASALDSATKALSAFDSPKLEAETLLSHSTGLTRTYFRTWPEKTLSTEQQQLFAASLQRRLQNEPLAYITGEQDFWSLSLKVTPDTLIPRSDTEVLVEQALARIPAGSTWQVADLGTGSGAIALSIATERPNCQIIATDISSKTLTVTEQNRADHQLANVSLKQGDWLSPLRAMQFELIASNPPYIDGDDVHLMQNGLPFEPQAALTPGADGLASLKTIIKMAHHYLCAPGWLLLEHGYNQAGEVQSLFRQYGYVDIQTYQDLGNNPRMTCGRYPLASSES